MKKLYLILSFLIVFNVLYSQEASIGNVYAKPGDIIDVPVYGKHFQYIAAIGLSVVFDTTALKFIKAENCYPPIDEQANWMDNCVDSNYRLAWYDSNINNIIVEDSFKLIDLQFYYKGGNALISFDTVNSVFYIEKFKKSQEEIPVKFFDGFVKESNTPGIIDTKVNSYNIYPNPVIDFLRITSPDKRQIKEIRLYNSLGMQIYSRHNLSMGKLSLDMNGMPKGLYMLVIESIDKITNKKILKL